MYRGNGAVGFSDLRRHASQNLDRTGPTYHVFLDRNRGSWPAFDKEQRGGFVAKTHLNQREVVHQVKVIRLFFEERFQFAARLSPSFLGGGTIAGNFLRPS